MRILLAVLVFVAPAFAQKKDPVKPPDAATIQKIKDETGKLKAAVEEAVKKQDVHDADLWIYVKAAEWIVKHNEWFTNDAAKQTFAVIAEGMKRAEAAKDGKTPWLEVEGRYVARGYRSVIDGSVQPYGVIYPHGYGKDPKRRWWLDVNLHGRDGSLTEIKHLYQHAETKAAPKDLDHVQINIYGRGNNAYRWAGEMDVLEAKGDFLSAGGPRDESKLVDPDRVVLKGFSMGGAGTWHLGLRHPGWFAAIQPGAGFATTHGYIAKLPDPLPDYQEKCLRIYDAYRYAENAFHVPVVAYSGALDKQKAAADQIEAELARLKLSDHMTHFVAPGLEHKFPPDWQKKVEAEVRTKTGPAADPVHDLFKPEHIRFATYWGKWARFAWVTIDGMDQQYERAAVDARWSWDTKTFVVNTTNVSRLILEKPFQTPFPASITLDGRKVVTNGMQGFEKGPDGWTPFDRTRQLPGPRKQLHSAGPIDDAFTRPFLCVVGSGDPFQPEMHKASLAQLDRFRREWDKWMRGSLPVKKDTELTPEDRKKSLILFGDPGSNKVIAEVLPKLPIRWTESELIYAGTKYDPAAHLPILIQPNPLSPNQYVVLNSGHTFHEADFQGTNALLYPRLGDYAVVKPTPTAKDPAAFEVVTAGLFDENWQFPKK